MQKRIVDFGAFVSDVSIKELIHALTGKTVLSGGEFSVTTDGKLEVAPFWIATETPYDSATGTFKVGMVISEDEPSRFLVPASSAATNWSVVVRHSDQQVEGGVDASVTLESGILENENLDAGMVLGWVKYPGNGVSLAQSMLIEAPKKKLEAVVSQGSGVNECAPFGCQINHRSGPLTEVTNGYELDYAGSVCFVDNTAGVVPAQDVLRWTFIVPDDDPKSIFIDYVLSTGQVIGLDIVDCSGNSSNSDVPNSTFLSGMLTSDFSTDATIESYNSGSVVVKRKRLRITNGQFISGKRFRIQATIQTPAGGTNAITAIGFGPYAKPISEI